MGGRAKFFLPLALCLWSPVGSADPALESLEACIQAMDEAGAAAGPASPTDRPHVAERCPQLREQLQDSTHANWLPLEWWSEDLTRQQLLALQRLLAEMQTSVPNGVAAPDPGGVAAVLEGLGREEAGRERSLWERLVQWLKRRLQAPDEETPAWVRWLEGLDLSGGGMRNFTQVLFLLVIAGALLAIFNELRAAGLFGRRFARKKQIAAASSGTDDDSKAAVAQALDTAPPAMQPSLLLARVLAALAPGQPPAADASLTHRQLRAAVQLQDDRARADFSVLAGCAERVRFAAGEPAPEHISEALSAGRRLLTGLAPT